MEFLGLEATLKVDGADDVAAAIRDVTGAAHESVAGFGDLDDALDEVAKGMSAAGDAALDQMAYGMSEAGAAAATATTEVAGVGVAAAEATPMVAGLGAAFTGLEATLAPLLELLAAYEGFKAIFTATNDAQEATNRLALAFRNVGLDVTKYQGAIDAQAEKLKAYGFTVADTESALAKMTMISGNAGESFKNLALASDLAAVRHTDLETAAQLVGRAMNGSFVMLQRWGLVSKGTGDHMAELTQRTHLQAEAMRNTLGGAVRQTEGELKTLAERIGFAVLGVVDWRGATDKVVVAIRAMQDWVERNKSSLSLFGDAVTQVFHGLGNLWDALRDVTNMVIDHALPMWDSMRRDFFGASGDIDTLTSTLEHWASRFLGILHDVLEKIVELAEAMGLPMALPMRKFLDEDGPAMIAASNALAVASAQAGQDAGRAYAKAFAIESGVDRTTRGASENDTAGAKGGAHKLPPVTSYTSEALSYDELMKRTEKMIPDVNALSDAQDTLQQANQKTIDTAEGLLKIGIQQVASGLAVAEGYRNQAIARQELNEALIRGNLLEKQAGEIQKTLGPVGLGALPPQQVTAFGAQLDKQLDTMWEPLSHKLTIDVPHMVTQGFDVIGQALGQGLAMLTQKGGAKDAFKVIGGLLMSSLGSMVQSLGMAMISIGVGLEVAKKSLQAIDPTGTIAAGIAMVALGKAFSSIVGADMGGGGGGSYSSGGYSGGSTPGEMSGTNLTSYVTPGAGTPFAAGEHWPGGPMTPITIIGTDDPTAQRQLVNLLANAARRGLANPWRG